MARGAAGRRGVVSAFDEMHEGDMQEWLNEMAEAEFDNSTGWRKDGDES